jgi:Ca2+-binding RTX toxin-like protein
MAIPNFNALQAGAQITRANLHWGPGVGQPAGNVSFGFRAGVPTYNDPDHNNLATFSQVTATQMTAARMSMLMWADVAGITFTEINPGGYTDAATILFANYFSATDATGAYAKFPGTPANGAGNAEDGDVWLNIQNQSTSALPYGSYDFYTFVHEIGHALGLEHPGPYNAAPGVSITYGVDNVYVEDTRQFSLMSYFNADNTGANHIDPLTGNIVYASTPLIHDIAAIQRLYGPNLATRAGDSTYGFFGNTGRAYDIASADRQVVFCIWDGGGTDWLNASGYNQGQRIDLRAGQFSDIGALTFNVSIAEGVDIENAVGGGGNDTIGGNDGANTLNGLGGRDALSGLGGADLLHGNEGNDTLDGGFGFIDTLYGDAGNDTYIISDQDVIVEFADFGTDTVRTSIQWTLGANLENIVLTGSANINATGNSLRNVLEGNSGNNQLDGAAELDSLAGGRGNDTYILSDTTLISGGYTWDNVIESINAGTDTVYATADGGRYTYQLPANVENLIATGVSIFRLWGNELNNTLTGNNAANEMAGFAGNDILDGNNGMDILTGGPGNDVYILEDLTFIDEFTGYVYDTVIEEIDGGNDSVFVQNLGTDFYYLDANVESVGVFGVESLTVIGNGLGNSFVGNNAANFFYGLGGNDTLLGYGGLDELYGGEGDDHYILDNATLINGAYTWDTVGEAAGAGIDTVSASADVGRYTYQLGANVENLVATGVSIFRLWGNELGNVLTGNAAANEMAGFSGNDTMQGGAGADTLEGGLGDDTYYVDTNADRVVENPGEGYDRVYATAFFSLSQVAEVEYLATANAAGAAGTDLTGSDTANTIVGDAGSNTLIGRGGDDTLQGGAGDDELTGSAGADRMEGGAGNDTYTTDGAGDTIVEAAGAGTDTVLSGQTFSLAAVANVENLTLTGGAAADGTGNALGNRLDGNGAANLLSGLDANDMLNGNDGNDTLDGGTGRDTMAGGLGNDTYNADNTQDQAIEGVAGGTDTVNSTAAFTLGANVENLILLGEARNGTGNAGANAIAGNGANNLLRGNEGNDTLDGGDGGDELDGGTGNDSMTGGGGSDQYYVDSAGDVVVETIADSATGGLDTVFSTVGYTLGANVENLRLLSGVGLSGTGNTLNNRLFGSNGADLLQGLGGHDRLEGDNGNDTLAGGAGNDTLTGGANADIFRFASAGAGNDRIEDFVRNGDRFQLSGGSFTSLTVSGLDTILAHNGGTIRIVGINNLNLNQWNALVIPGGESLFGLPPNALAAASWYDGLPSLARFQHDTIHSPNGDWLHA